MSDLLRHALLPLFQFLPDFRIGLLHVAEDFFCLGLDLATLFKHFLGIRAIGPTPQNGQKNAYR